MNINLILRNNIAITIQGWDYMSKQSNQRYRKEKDKKQNSKYDNTNKSEAVNKSDKQQTKN